VASFDSSDLLKQFNQATGRAAADAISDADKYARLARAQNFVISQVMGIAPRSLYPKVSYASMPTLTTTDNQVFTFGSDANGYPTFPGGYGGIYTALNNIPDSPWVDGVDYINEGSQIRIPNNRTYSGTLYWYGVGQPADISASVQPSLFPEDSRELIVIEAARRFGQEGNRNLSLADEMKIEFANKWPIYCMRWKTQYKQGGALSFTGRTLALAAQIPLGA
jgi:hypothetical protein